ncbi:MAG: hypothetical protein IIA61_03855 [Candidatus Marinimicrobia bacterium]|nr:hypothetical protein [Candidatus Neomarinimicrobiota bacterium]
MVLTKRNTRLSCLLISIIFPGLVFSQSRVGDWKSYTSTLDVRQSIELDGKIISATSGGILIFDRLTESFEVLTNIEGLIETDLSTIAIDGNGYLWLGSSSPRGVVQIYDLDKKSSVKYFDLELSQITAITTTDSTGFVAYSQNLDWGILEFIYQDGEFIFRQIFNPSEERLDYIYDLVVRGDSLYVATDKGLFVGDYRQFILNYPQNWDYLDEFLDAPVTRLNNLGSQLVFVANGRIWSYTDSLQLRNSSAVGSSHIKDVTILNDGTIYALTKTKLVEYNDQGSFQNQWFTNRKSNRLLILGDGDLLLSSGKGIEFWDRSDKIFISYIPNTLVTNLYTALTVLQDGRLVAAGEKGVSILSEEGWYNLVPSRTDSSFHYFTNSDYDKFVADTVHYKTSRVWSVVERIDGTIFFSFQGVSSDTNEFGDPIGGGIISFHPDSPAEYVVYDTTQNQLNPFNDIGYLNIRHLYIDDSQNLWISNFGAQNLDKKITVYTELGDWFHMPQTGIGGPSIHLSAPTDILVTRRGKILVGGSNDNGLFVLTIDKDTDGDGIKDVFDPDIDNDGILNESDPDDDDDGIPDEVDSMMVTWQYLSQSNNELAANTIWALIESEQDIIWILTSKGLQRLTFNSQFTQVTPYFFTYFSGVPFGEGSHLRLDIRGNLWASSVTNGVYILLANSTPWPDWDGFRHANSHLLSDDVTDIAIDNARGIAYIATSKGINALKIPFAKPKKSYSNVITFPSPFRIPSEFPMVIDGLVDNSTLKIMTLSGKVLRELSGTFISMNSYQAFWDGKTNNGEYVGTGIYLVGIYSENGQSMVTKIVVIRE